MIVFLSQVSGDLVKFFLRNRVSDLEEFLPNLEDLSESALPVRP